MRNPERWRNIALACFLIGPVAAFASFALPPAAAGDGLRATLLCLGIIGVLFGGFGALLFHQALKAKRKLERGEGLLARWRIPPAEWREFLALNSERNSNGERRPNEFSPREEVPGQGIEILVGEDAIEIDGSLHALPRHGAPEITRFEFDEGRTRPSVIEFDLTYPGGGSGASGVPRGPTYGLLRFPVPAGAQREALAIVSHYGQLTPGKPTYFHGRGDGSDPEDLSSCLVCGFQTHRFISVCERCGAPMQSRRWARRFGRVLLVLGLLLSAGMTVLLANLLPLLLHPGVQVGNSRFDGSPGMAVGIVAILGMVEIFGIICVGYGIFQMVTGRRALGPAKALLAIASVLYLIALWIHWTGRA